MILKLIDASKSLEEKKFSSNLEERRQNHDSEYKLGQITRNADDKKVLSYGDTTNWSYELNTITKKENYTSFSNRINYLFERNNGSVFRARKLTLHEYNLVMEKLNSLN